MSDTRNSASAEQVRGALLDDLAALAAGIETSRTRGAAGRVRESDIRRGHELFDRADRGHELLDGGELARFEVVMVEMLDGGEARYAAERVVHEPVYNAWVDTTVSDPQGHEKPWGEQVSDAGVFPDMPTVHALEDDGIAYDSMDRENVRTCLEELHEHMDQDPEEYGPLAFETYRAELTGGIRSGLDQDLFAAGEAARLHRIAAALDQGWPVTPPAGHQLWDMVARQEVYEPWARQQAAIAERSEARAPRGGIELEDTVRMRREPTAAVETGSVRVVQAADHIQLALHLDQPGPQDRARQQWDRLRAAVDDRFGPVTAAPALDADVRAQQIAAAAGRTRPPQGWARQRYPHATTARSDTAFRVHRHAHGLGW